MKDSHGAAGMVPPRADLRVGGGGGSGGQPAGPGTSTDAPPPPPPPPPPRQRLAIFERFLSVWVVACMVLGAVLGAKVPRLAAALAGVQVGGINILVSILVWCMIFPMLLAVDFSSLRQAVTTPGPIALTSLTNYAVQLFLMFGVATLFLRVVFARWLPPGVASQFIAGCVLLGCAPCTAMVFVWSTLVGGHPGYTVVQVAVNDALLLALYVPLAGALIGAASLPPPYGTIAISVALFLLAPLLAATAVRVVVHRWKGPAAVDRLRRSLAPLVGAGLLATLVLIFLFQGKKIASSPGDIAMIALPLALQTFGVWGFVYAVGGWVCGMAHAFLAPASMIATSNFFELAVATAAAVYGPDSGAALATTVGVLVEVPLMLILVWCCNKLKAGTDRRARARLAAGGWWGWLARLCGGHGHSGGVEEVEEGGEARGAVVGPGGGGAAAAAAAAAAARSGSGPAEAV